MGIHETPTPEHWNYFLALEDDVVRMSRYLEPTTDNFESYSLELMRILFGAASEVDVVSKRLCQKLSNQSKADNITKYKKEILASYPQFTSVIVEIPRFGLTLTPWVQWKTDPSPFWWRAYNNVKHHRHTHFAEASLKHTLNAVAGLFVLLLFYYREEGQNGQLNPDPVIFRAGAPFHVDRLMWGPGANVYQLLPDGNG
jgi:hypothetical protein